MKKFSMCLFIIGMVLAFSPHFFRWLQPFRAFEEAVIIKTGPVLEKTFRASHSAPYDLEMSATVADESKQAECLLTGQSTLQGTCGEVQSQVDLTWELSKNSQVIESGSVVGGSESSWREKTVTRLLGTADLESGSDYTLRITSLRDLPQFTPFNPKISVVTNSSYSKGRSALMSLVQLVGYILMGASAGISLWQSRKRSLAQIV